MRVMNRIFQFALVIFTVQMMAGSVALAADFRSDWPQDAKRYWIGPEYWSNPLQDWRVRDGRVECWRSGDDRNVYLLTHELLPQAGSLDMRVTIGRLDKNEQLAKGWIGFKIGSVGEFNDYRDSAVRGVGLNVGLKTDGRLFIGNSNKTGGRVSGSLDDITLHLTVNPAGVIGIRALDAQGKVLAEYSRNDIDASWLVGHMAIVCANNDPRNRDYITARPSKIGNPDIFSDPAMQAKEPGASGGEPVRFWFRDWLVSGSKVAVTPGRAWGPILFTQYTLSRSVMKLTAQLAPVGNDSRTVQLQIQETGQPGWQTINEVEIDPLARTATFRVADWDDSRDVEYRVAYTSKQGKNSYHTGTVKKDPVHKEDVVVAAFTGNNDFGFPHADIVRNVRQFSPDLLVYTGDQIYERVGGYGVDRSDNMETSTLDYLRKWYILGWEYKEMMKEIPSIYLPDDHDVYQGNIWGAGGRGSSFGNDGKAGQDAGGYCMPPVWVNMVQRTQTSHMPDPWDPTPIDQGISVYYCDMVVGGVSFAVIEDRKFKSAPARQLPKADIRNGWIQNPNFDSAKDGDVPTAILLGDRQLDFLEDWSADWSSGVWMKSVISQTIFTNLATLPKPADNDDVTPTLRVNAPGEYAKDEVRVQDHDSNAWPQTGRNNALTRMRRGFAFHIAGDQHLGSTIQYGVDEWNDAGYAICVPSVANVWPRRWFPVPSEGNGPLPGKPDYTGNWQDGFGNKVTVHAVSNPHSVGIAPTWINHRAPGYGIIKFNRDTRKITATNWPRWVDVTQAGAQPYPGWPVTVDQQDNYGRKAAAWLPSIEVQGMDDPVVQIVNESNDEIIYTLRINGSVFRPKVFQDGDYTVKVGEPGTAQFKVLTGVKSTTESDYQRMIVEF
jgi:alkaline phosphatase D